MNKTEFLEQFMAFNEEIESALAAQNLIVLSISISPDVICCMSLQQQMRLMMTGIFLKHWRLAPPTTPEQ